MIVIGRFTIETTLSRPLLIWRIAKGVRSPRRTRKRVTTAETTASAMSRTTISATSWVVLRPATRGITAPSCRTAALTW